MTLPGADDEVQDSPGVGSITICVIDSTHGRPAEGVPFRLQRKLDGEWQDDLRGQTDFAGRLAGLWDVLPESGRIYRVEFDVDHYFACLGMVALHPTVIVAFRLLDSAEKHRICVLITPHSHLAHRST